MVQYGLVGITPKQFEELKSRMGSPKRMPVPLMDAPARSRGGHAIVLGIDPSLRGTGYGIIHFTKPQPKVLAQGTIKCPPGWDRSRCLLSIVETLRDVLRRHKPSVCAIEGLFFAQNLQTALIMGEARGASLVAAAEAGLEIYEIAPRKVKQAVVGYGAAQKSAVAKMVQRMLSLSETPSPDAADALALAIAYTHEQSSFGLGGPKKI